MGISTMKVNMLDMRQLILFFVCLSFVMPVFAEEAEAIDEVRKLSRDIQSLKQEVVLLNKDLRLMEEALLFPSSTKFSVFVSVNSGQFFTLNSIKLKLNGELVSAHIYSKSERDALIQGGVQRFHVTNLNEGKHTATAFFTGVGPNGREYKRGIDIEFEKNNASGYMELIISDDGSIQEPVFDIKQW